MPLSGSLLQTLNARTSAAVRIVAIFTVTVAKMPHNLLIDRCLRPFCEGIVRLDGESGADALFVALGIRQKPSPVPKRRREIQIRRRRSIRAHFGDFHEIRSGKPV